MEDNGHPWIKGHSPPILANKKDIQGTNRKKNWKEEIISEAKGKA